MRTFTPAAQQYFEGLTQPFQALEAWALSDHTAGKRMRIVDLVIVAVGVAALILTMVLAARAVPVDPAPPVTSNDCIFLDCAFFLGEGSTDPGSMAFALVFFVSLVVIGVASWQLHAFINRRMRPSLPTSISGDQISFVAAVQLANVLTMHERTGVRSLLDDARRYGRIAVGLPPPDWEYLEADEEPARLRRPSHVGGEPIGGGPRRLRQARATATSLRAQELVPISRDSATALQRLGNLASVVHYNIRNDGPLAHVADLAVAFAEAMYQLITRERKIERNEPDLERGDLDRAVSEVLEGAEVLPEGPEPQPRADEPGLGERLVARFPRILFFRTVVGWFISFLVVVYVAIVAIELVWPLDNATKALILLPTAAVLAIGMGNRGQPS